MSDISNSSRRERGSNCDIQCTEAELAEREACLVQSDVAHPTMEVRSTVRDTHIRFKKSLHAMQRVCCRVLPVSIVLALLILLYLAKMQPSLEVAPKELDSVSALLGDDATREVVLHVKPEKEKIPADFYGVMFDAGSTGTRVHVFHFQDSPPGVPPFLMSEVYNYTKLPLSKYAENPTEGAKSLDGLLAAALASIPEHRWSSTPVALRATAGLRLLPEVKAQSLLDEVYSRLKASPLHVERQEVTASIMDGNDEGIFMWVTVNFLNGALTSTTSETFGTLDLGGGSTQVTFLPQRQDTLTNPVHRDFLTVHPFLKHNYQLYSKSYLSLGLKAARLEILKRERENPIFEGSSVEELAPEKFTTSCLPPLTSASWEFGGDSYTASSSNSHSADIFENCQSVVQSFIEDMVLAPAEIQDQPFYALSYFWERAAELHRVDWVQGGKLLVKDYRDTAIDVCSDSKSYADTPFHCMDMVYLFSLLSHGYKFNDDVQLTVTNRIRGYEVSWALGATLDLLRTHWEHTSKL